VDKNKKDINYWDKYNSSGKYRKDPYHDSSKKYNSKTLREDSSTNKSARGNSESEGRIIGSEYKKKNTPKKRRRSPALRFTILIIIILIAGFFIFYAIDNHLFSGSKTAQNSNGILSSGSSISENVSESSSDNSSSTTQLDDSSLQDSSITSIAVANGSQAQDSSGNPGQSLWQALLLFFKNFGKSKSEIPDYPKKIDLDVYFAVLGNDELFGSEERTILAGTPKIAAANVINELLKGPYEDFNFAVIPAGTKLLDVEVANKIAKVNFSQEFLSESLDSSILDYYIIYTIVNTLTGIPEIEALSFSIDGKDIKVYGSVDLQLPAIRNEKYIEGNNKWSAVVLLKYRERWTLPFGYFVYFF